MKTKTKNHQPLPFFPNRFIKLKRTRALSEAPGSQKTISTQPPSTARNKKEAIRKLDCLLSFAFKYYRKMKRITAANTIRYTAKGVSLILLISFKKKRMANKAKTNALIKPATKNGIASHVKYSRFLINDKKLAPAMIGTAMIT